MSKTTILKDIDSYSYEELISIAKKNNIKVESNKDYLLNFLMQTSNYIPYPDFDDNKFNKKIFEKKEFYNTKYDLEKYRKNIEDPQKEICPSESKQFKLLDHQIFLRTYMNSKTPYNGVLLYHGLGSGKCVSKDTPILMYDGSIKMVQDIIVGEQVMGDDSTPRNILSLGRGIDTMYEIIPIKGESFTTNSEHILCLKYSNGGVYKRNDKRIKNQTTKYIAEFFNKETCGKSSKVFDTELEARTFLKNIKEEDKIIEIAVKDFLNLSKSVKSKLKIYRKGVEFKSSEVELDPYALGFWIGDGTTKEAQITTEDFEVVEYFKDYIINQLGGYIHQGKDSEFGRNSLHYSFRNCNFKNLLKKYNLINNKYIPNEYKINSREVRLQVLAGLIDSDGHLHKNGGYEIVQKLENIIDDILYLARSLGFAAYKKEKKTSWTHKGIKKYGKAYRVFISGDIDEIPVKIKRKIASPRRQKKDVLVTGFKVVEKPKDNYYGFTLDGNHRFLFGDFTVTHNTCSAITIAESYKKTLKKNSTKKILVLVAGTSIEENFKKEIHDIKKGYNQCTFSEYINYHELDSNKDKERKSSELIDKNYEIEHYQKFTNIISTKYKELPLEKFAKWISNIFSNRVFVIDEVHNLKVKDSDDTIKRYDAVKLVVKYSKNMKLILLSGTPMSHSPREIIDVLNLLLVNDNFPQVKVNDIFINDVLKENAKPLLNKLSKGYISFIRTENPLTFAKREYPNNLTVTQFMKSKFQGLDIIDNIQENIKSSIKIIPCKMGKIQREKYLNFLKSNNVNIQDLIQLNIIGYDIKDKDSVLKINHDAFHESKLPDISMKLYNMLQNIKDGKKGPVFIYSNYRDKGVLMIGSMLLRNGIDLARKGNDNIFFNNKVFKSKRKRPFDKDKLCAICCKSKDKCEEKDHKFTTMVFDFIIGETQEDVQRKIIRKFNDHSNIQGGELKILIGSSVLKEGVSLLHVRQLHVLEPWHNRSRIEQVIGRGLRHCSHKKLSKEERNISIHLYASIIDEKYNITDDNRENVIGLINEILNNDSFRDTVPISLSKYLNGTMPLFSYDIIMYKRSELLDINIKKVERVLQMNAVDCAVNKELNIDTLDEEDRYECNNFGQNYNFNKNIEDLDLSTFDNIFLMPQVNYVISLIKKHFEKNIILRFNDFIKHNKIQEDIYIQRDYYIIRKALDTIVPEPNKNFYNFPHIFKGYKGNIGYIINRIINDNDNIYIFQMLDNQNKKERSEFEQIPFYERKNEDDMEENISLNTFLNIIERKETKKRGKELYIGSIFDTSAIGTAIKSKQKNIGAIALEEIKRLDPPENHKNDANIVGIIIKAEIFKDNMWLRYNVKTTDTFGKNCMSFKRTELLKIIKELWNNSSKNNNFKEKYQPMYDNIINNEVGYKKKEIKCKFIQIMLRFLQIIKFKNIDWFKEL